MALSERLLWTGRLPTLARSGSVLALAWGTVEVADRFNLFGAPRTPTGFALFVLVSLCAILGIELVVAHASRDTAQLTPRTSVAPEKAFAQSVVAYAEALGSTNRDDAVIELRAWATRFLHLGALHEERIALGETALRSAMANGDRATQASILMDDLGWTVHESGDSKKALSNIEEAIGVIDREIARIGPGVTQQLTALKVKALRHRANVSATLGGADLAISRGAFKAPRQLAMQLSDPLKAVELAQLDHSESQVISLWIGRGLGPDGKIDPTGSSAKLLSEAIKLAEHAESAFHVAGDRERELKALKLLCELLRRDAARQPALEASERLSRLQQRVARNIDRAGAQRLPL